MNAVRYSLLAIVISLGLASSAEALISNHLRERVGCSGWSDQLTAIVNDPARVSGQIGPLGPSARFQYQGDKDLFNRVLALYAALDQKEHVLYLGTDAVSGSGGPDFELSITHDGNGFLFLRLPGRIALGDLKIPAGVSVEATVPVGMPIDPERRAKAEAEIERIKAFVATLKKPQP